MESGYYARRDDPISLAFIGFLNRMLRSSIATCLFLFLTISMTAVGIWNGMVDLYVAENGITESAPILSAERGRREDGYTVQFSYRYGHVEDSLRLIEPWWQNLDPGVGQCSLLTNPTRNQQNATVKVTYLPEKPGVYVVKGDLFSEFLRWIVTGVFLLLSLCAGWNLLRIGNGASPLRLPTWSDMGYH